MPWARKTACARRRPGSDAGAGGEVDKAVSSPSAA